MLIPILKKFLPFWENPYISGGMGIKERYASNKKLWDNHFHLTREFQKNCLSSRSNSERCVVYGAGRLYDFDKDSFKEKFREILLVDADPLANVAWKSFIKEAARSKCGVRGEVVEVTGAISAWSDSFARIFRGSRIKTDAEISSALLSLLNIPYTPWTPPPSTVVLSLNIMGQIPLVWRDIALDLLERYAPTLLDESGMLVGKSRISLIRTMRELQSIHLRQLMASQPEEIVIITDDEFYFYTHSEAEWQVEPAFYVREQIPPTNYKVGASASWLWHIAREGIEEKEFGSIHKIVAMQLIRR